MPLVGDLPPASKEKQKEVSRYFSMEEVGQSYGEDAKQQRPFQAWRSNGTGRKNTPQ